MSNLDFPISALKTLLRSVSTAKSLTDKPKQMAGIERAIGILQEKKLKDEEKKVKKEKKKRENLMRL